MKQEIVWLLNEKYGGQLTEKAKKDITRLGNGEPVDYVIGYKNFLGCKIDLRYKPLIPREETEFWMKKAIEDLRGTIPRKLTGDRPPYLLDMFAGSGCCGIAVLKNVPNSHCDFVDIDDNCLKQIRLNLKLNGIDKKRYRVIKSDVFEKLLKSNFNSKTCSKRAKRVEGYDLILANPPYIGLREKRKVQKSVLNFEPNQALFAKNNGLYFIEKFLKQAKNYLSPQVLPQHHNGKNIVYGKFFEKSKEAVWRGSVIYMEFGYNQKKEVERLLKKFGYHNFEFHKDQFNKWRFLEIKN